MPSKGKENGISDNPDGFDTISLNNIKTIAAGATPKLTKSASESKTLPKVEMECNSLAKKPSKKSNTAANSIHIPAHLISLLIVKYMDMLPQIKLKHVIPFGIILLIHRNILIQK